jgi:hypothetical protein
LHVTIPQIDLTGFIVFGGRGRLSGEFPVVSVSDFLIIFFKTLKKSILYIKNMISINKPKEPGDML